MPTTTLPTITVRERPAPQGSLRSVGAGRFVPTSPHLRTWREAVKQAAIDQVILSADHAAHIIRLPLAQPCDAQMTFTLPRPGAHYGTGRNATTLKPTAPTWPGRTPDLDKLVRSCLDALTAAGIWADDALVAQLTATKTYPDTTLDALPVPGAVIRVALL